MWRHISAAKTNFWPSNAAD